MEKMRNVTKKDMQEAVISQEIMDRMEEEIKKHDSYDVPENLSIGFKIFKNGQNMEMIKCKKCGHIMTIENSDYNCGEIECEGCHSINKFYPYGGDSSFSYGFYSRRSSHISDDKKVLLFKKIEPGFFIAALYVRLIYQKRDEKAAFVEGAENDFLTSDIEIKYSQREIIVFSPKKGVLMISYNYGKVEIPKNDDRNNRCLDDFFKGKLIMNDDVVEFFDAIKTNESGELSNKSLKEASVLYNKNLIWAAKAAKEGREKNKPKTINDSTEAANIESVTKMIAKSKQETLSFVTENNGNIVKYHLFCSCGNNEYGQVEKQNGYIPPMKCSNCGKFSKKVEPHAVCYPSKVSLSVQNNNCFKYELVNNDTVLARGFKYDIEYVDGGIFITHVVEQTRFFFNKKSVEIYAKGYVVRDGESVLEWSKGRRGSYNITDIKSGYSSDRAPILLNTNEELKQIINDSFLQRTGVKQAWGLEENLAGLEPAGMFTSSSYLYNWYAKPYIELSIKSGLINATHDLIIETEPDEDRKKASNIEELFGVTKTILKIARKRNLGLTGIGQLALCYKIQSNFSIELWDELVSSGVNINHVCEVCHKNSCSITKMMEYLQSCYDYQCIEKSQALTIYADYSRMATKMGYNMSDKSIRWPNSLKKEHDKAMFAYRVVEDEMKKKAFEDNCNIFRKYEYKDDKYAIIVPRKSEEVVAEGQRQRHCVASYISSIEEGRTCICFLRRRSDVDTPYFTVEVRDGYVYQVKGYCNCYPDRSDRELIEFIEKWAKKNSLILDYRNH